MAAVPFVHGKERVTKEDGLARMLRTKGGEKGWLSPGGCLIAAGGRTRIFRQ